MLFPDPSCTQVFQKVQEESADEDEIPELQPVDNKQQTQSQQILKVKSSEARIRVSKSKKTSDTNLQPKRNLERVESKRELEDTHHVEEKDPKAPVVQEESA